MAATAEPVTEPTEEPAPAEPEPAAPANPEPAVAGADATTQVVVTGLTSFGAITSFKQSLESVNGISKVALGLGTSGEFIFTAVHREGFDLVGRDPELRGIGPVRHRPTVSCASRWARRPRTRVVVNSQARR